MPSYALALSRFTHSGGFLFGRSGAACPAGLEYRSSEKWFMASQPTPM